MNLVSLELRVLARGRETDHFAMGVDVAGKLITFFHGKPKQFPEHGDHIFVGVIVVIPQEDLIPWLAFRFATPVSLRPFQGWSIGFGGCRC